MTTDEPLVADTTRVNAIQAARLLGISRPTLKKYTDVGQIRVRYRRNASGRKVPFYLGLDLKKFWRSEE